MTYRCQQRRQAKEQTKRMGYYIRVLSQNESHVPASALEDRLRSDNLTAVLRVDRGVPDAWEQITILDGSFSELSVVERNPVAPDSLAEEELQEFVEEVDDASPRSAARWLAEYLPTVRVIYAFQILGSLKRAGWLPIHAIEGELWGTLGGIVQADGEGFTNPDGYHILWRFSDHVSGPWQMAVLNDANEWVTFEMELGNREQRKAFLAGKVPV